MTPQEQKVMELSLEALEMYCEHGAILKPIETRDAIKEALAQEKALQALHDENELLGLYKDAYAGPEQEPVGYFNANSDGKWEQSDSNDGVPFYAALPPQPKEPEQKPLEYWNAVEGWVKIDEVREHFDSVGCATIYKTAGEGRVPLSLCKAQPDNTAKLYEELRSIIDGGSESFTHEDAVQYLKNKLAQPTQDWIKRERAFGYREGHQNALKQMAQQEQRSVSEHLGEPVAWREAYSKVIKALAGIVTVPTPDKLFDLDAIPRDPVMALVQDIKAALDKYKPPQQRKPLTMFDTEKLAKQCRVEWTNDVHRLCELAAAHGITKETP